jgi:hypothetical protein
MRKLGNQAAGMAMLAGAALLVAEPRLHLAFEDQGDPRPHRMALTAEIMGKALGVVISWSERAVPHLK